MIEAIFIVYCAFIGVTILVALANFLSAPRLNKKQAKDHSKKISVCIPARNEEHNITNILHDILNQTYPDIEIFVLDDNSEDSTYRIVSSIRKLNKSVNLISGKPLPPGWTGKNWACCQLSQKAQGDILFFIDADTRLSSWAVESAAAYMNEYSLGMLSVFPSQLMLTLSERLIVPIMDWILLAFLPLRMVYLSPWLSFVAANGQFIAVTKKAYKKIGGHESVANMVVEDMELARNVKKHSLQMMTFVGYNGVKCRMYKSFSDAFTGFTKNFFPGFNTSPLMFALMLIFLNVLFTLPFILLFFLKEFVLIVFLILLQRVFISRSNKQNFLFNVILHPVQMIIMTLIGLNSMHKSAKGKLKWKGRHL
ncbi:MAG: glycosyltransferase [Spirochaetes bacterium]|nr:glycosyltransferase [Spirochaetota bacterium]